MNSKNIVTSTKDAMERVKTIDDLSQEISKLNADLIVKTEKIKDLGLIILKNLKPEKFRTGLKTKNKWSGEEELIFTNYGFGVQQSYSTNATSFKEMNNESFIKILGFIKENLDKIKPMLKPKNFETLREFVMDYELLKRAESRKEFEVNFHIDYINDYLLNDVIKNIVVSKLTYNEHTFYFDLMNKDRTIRVSLINPRLDDALVIEQIFDETKDILEKEIALLNQEESNYDKFIQDTKTKFQAKMMIAELTKTK